MSKANDSATIAARERLQMSQLQPSADELEQREARLEHGARPMVGADLVATESARRFFDVPPVWRAVWRRGRR